MEFLENLWKLKKGREINDVNTQLLSCVLINTNLGYSALIYLE